MTKEQIELLVEDIAKVFRVETRLKTGKRSAKFMKAVAAVEDFLHYEIDGKADAEAEAERHACGYLDVREDGLHAEVTRQGDVAKQKSAVVIRNDDELENWCETWNVGSYLCSSSVDFPEEYTQDPAIIALCNRIRA